MGLLLLWPLFSYPCPGPVNLVWHLPSALVVTWLALCGVVPAATETGRLWIRVAIIGVGHPLVMAVLSILMLPITFVLALAASWVGTAIVLERFLDLLWEDTHRLTARVLGPTRTVWAGLQSCCTGSRRSSTDRRTEVEVSSLMLVCTFSR